MTGTEYSELAMFTAPDERDIHIEPSHEGLLLGALGLCGESGEIAEMVKKHVFHGHPIDLAKLVKEAGDVLWYVNFVAQRCCGVDITDVMAANIAKLKARYPEGHFSSERSQNRAAGDE